MHNVLTWLYRHWMCLYPAIVIWGFVIALCWSFNWPDLDAAAWASWVQAVGSIVALGIAIWIPYHQKAMDRTDEIQRAIETELQHAKRLRQLAGDVVMVTKRLYPYLKRVDAGEPSRIEATFTADILDRMATFEASAPTIERLDTLQETRRTLIALHWLLQELRAGRRDEIDGDVSYHLCAATELQKRAEEDITKLEQQLGLASSLKRAKLARRRAGASRSSPSHVPPEPAN